MKRSKFTEDQIIGIMKEHAEAWQRHWFERHGDTAKRQAVAHLGDGHGMGGRAG